MTSNSNYMGSGLAHTMDQKVSKQIAGLNDLGSGLQANASAKSLAVNNYTVPSLDGKLLPAQPINLALKYKPPTVAVVYLMKDSKSGKQKKYIHEIKINFEKQSEPIDVNRMCDEICRKETLYLNPAFISRQQVFDLLNKLHNNHIKNKENLAPASSQNSQPPKALQNEVARAEIKQENTQQKVDQKKDQNQDGSAVSAADNNQKQAEGRKPNFFERKRFVDYEKNNSDSDQSHTDKKVHRDINQSIEVPVQQEIIEEDFVVNSVNEQKPKSLVVRSGAPPPMKNPEEKKIDFNLPELKTEKINDLDIGKKNIEQIFQEKDNSESEYNDDWNSDKKDDIKQQERNSNIIDFFGHHPEPINEYQYGDDNGGVFGELENEYKKMNDSRDVNKNNNPFGQSITKEVLQQSKKEIKNDLKLGDHFDDGIIEHDSKKLDNSQKTNNPFRKNLEIEIEDNLDFDAQNIAAHQILNDKVIENEKLFVEPNLDIAPNGQPDDEDYEDYTEEDIMNQFDELYRNDQALAQVLGEFPDRYSLDEKLSIIQAYKKGGGVAGLADIIEDEDDEDMQQQINDLNNQHNQKDGVDPGAAGDYGDQDDEEEMNIDLDNPDDVVIIEREFQKLYDNDEQFKMSFGEEALSLGPLQKYQIIDAYNKNGMEAVMALLTTSADQSAIMQQMDENGMMQQDLMDMGNNGGDESVIINNGKKYNRIQIEGLGDDEEYLIDENGDIYSLDFKYITNMGDNEIAEDDE